MRVRIIEKAHKTTGFKRYYLYITLLNHSKWNHNNYSSYVVEYCAVSSTDNISANSTYRRAYESEIVCLVEFNSKIKLRFFYILGKSMNFEAITERNAENFVKDNYKLA